MTRPIKSLPGFQPFRLYDLVRGRSPRKLFLPPGAAARINRIFAQCCIDVRLFVVEPKPVESIEESDKRLEEINERSD